MIGVIVFSKELESKDDAIYLERFIKRMKSKTFIFKIIDNPNILDDILSKKYFKIMNKTSIQNKPLSCIIPLND